MLHRAEMKKKVLRVVGIIYTWLTMSPDNRKGSAFFKRKVIVEKYGNDCLIPLSFIIHTAHQVSAPVKCSFPSDNSVGPGESIVFCVNIAN